MDMIKVDGGITVHTTSIFTDDEVTREGMLPSFGKSRSGYQIVDVSRPGTHDRMLTLWTFSSEKYPKKLSFGIISAEFTWTFRRMGRDEFGIPFHLALYPAIMLSCHWVCYEYEWWG